MTLERVLAYDDFQIYASRYSENAGMGAIGVGFMINLLPLVFSVIYLVKSQTFNDADKLLIFLYSCSFLMIPFSRSMSIVGRIGIYFGAIGIAALPKLYSQIKPNFLRFSVTSTFVLITMYDYYLFFTGETFSQGYSKFHTIFEVL